MMFGTYFGTFAPWADHTRIGPNHLWTYLQPFLSVLVVQIFFIGSAFFAVAALTRKIFIVYLQGVALFMIYLIGITVFFATRSLERFWSGHLRSDRLHPLDDVTRYWTVVEKNTLFLTWSPALVGRRISLQPPALDRASASLSLGTVWALFPMSVEALTARSQGRRAAKAKEQELTEARPVRSSRPARLPDVHQSFTPATTLAQYISLSRLRLRNILRDIPFWAIVALLIAFGINNDYFAGHLAEQNVWPVTYLMVQAVEGSALLIPLHRRRPLCGGAALARARHALRRHPRRPAHARIHRLALPSHRRRRGRTHSARRSPWLVGIVMQTIAGYYHYELLQYFKELYLVTFPQILASCLLASSSRPSSRTNLWATAS